MLIERDPCGHQAELDDIVRIADVRFVSSFIFVMHWAAIVDLCECQAKFGDNKNKRWPQNVTPVDYIKDEDKKRRSITSIY